MSREANYVKGRITPLKLFPFHLMTYYWQTEEILIKQSLYCSLRPTVSVYRKISYHLDRQVLANSEDPDQTARKDQALHCFNHFNLLGAFLLVKSNCLN